ncbi:MAG: hypothetical protein N2440_00310 [Actinobacteria bacterium]|nr:hypothetical protein [Actinomycetota bacterium]
MDIYEEFLEGKKAFIRGDYELAVYYLRKVKRKEPSKISVRELLGRAYYSLRKYKKALQEFEFIIFNKPDQDYAYFAAGLCLIKLGRREEGVENLRIALALNPTNSDYKNYLDRFSG